MNDMTTVQRTLNPFPSPLARSVYAELGSVHHEVSRCGVCSIERGSRKEQPESVTYQKEILCSACITQWQDEHVIIRINEARSQVEWFGHPGWRGTAVLRSGVPQLRPENRIILAIKTPKIGINLYFGFHFLCIVSGSNG